MTFHKIDKLTFRPTAVAKAATNTELVVFRALPVTKDEICVDNAVTFLLMVVGIELMAVVMFAKNLLNVVTSMIFANSTKTGAANAARLLA